VVWRIHEHTVVEGGTLDADVARRLRDGHGEAMGIFWGF
jgi:hypothetical protein